MPSVIHSEMLVLARESRGLTQSEVARLLQLSQGEISKIETGLRLPADELLQRFVQLYRYPPEFFSLNDPIRSFGSPCVYHRKRQCTPDKVLRQLLALVNVRRIQIRRLLQAAELDIENRFHRLDVEEYSGGPEQIAQMVRASWKLPPGPVQNLTQSIEDAGGLVLRSDFGTTKVDALSQWLPDLPPLFFVNRLIPADRLRFTLAHEIGHIIMHQIPTEDMEREADRFAAEFLMPADAIRPHLYDISLPRLAALKPHWKVSMNALLKRAGDLGLITPRSKSYLWTQMGKLGYRTQEPVEIPMEEPTLISELIDLHRRDLGYTNEELGRLLVTHEVEALVPPRHGLRIVKPA